MNLTNVIKKLFYEHPVTLVELQELGWKLQDLQRKFLSRPEGNSLRVQIEPNGKTIYIKDG